MNPIDFYRLAVELYSDTATSQAKLRTAIGRAYYSAFLCARDRMSLEGVKQDVHKQVINKYHSTGNQQDTLLANNLEDLRALRTDADYRCKTDVTRRNAGKSLGLSKKILTQLGLIN